MPEQIVAQVKFNLARDADHDPAGKKLEDALDRRHSQQFQRVGQQFFASNAGPQTVHSVAEDKWKQDPYAVIDENADCAYEIAAAILLQVGK